MRYINTLTYLPTSYKLTIYTFLFFSPVVYIVPIVNVNVNHQFI